MSKGTPQRTFRVDDGLWGEFVELARRLGDTPSAVIRDCMRGYVELHKDDVWARALAVADERGDDLSEVVCRFLERYIEHPNPVEKPSW